MLTFFTDMLPFVTDMLPFLLQSRKWYQIQYLYEFIQIFTEKTFYQIYSQNSGEYAFFIQNRILQVQILIRQQKSLIKEQRQIKSYRLQKNNGHFKLLFKFKLAFQKHCSQKCSQKRRQLFDELRLRLNYRKFISIIILYFRWYFQQGSNCQTNQKRLIQSTSQYLSKQDNTQYATTKQQNLILLSNYTLSLKASLRILEANCCFCSDFLLRNYKIIKTMGNQSDANKNKKLSIRVQEWSVYQGKLIQTASLAGQFYNDYSSSQIHYRRFYADDEKIYFCDGNVVKYMPFFLTTMEEKFYYSHGERIYALKLTNNSFFTILSTYDRQNFIKFYCALAKFCILNEFDRHFQVKQEVGKGSYGTVYRGINRLSNQQVALKVFDKTRLQQNTYCRKVVQNEIYVLQKLKKVNLSPLYEVFQTSDCIVLVLEMAKQGDLLNFLLKEETIINDKLIKHVFEKILQNLDALHAAGIIHRDIKPQNVVVRKSNGQVSLFLCDFSISIVDQDIKCEQMKRMQAGSRGYIAPQVLNSNLYTQKCDMYSFGCLAYLLLSGKKLFEGVSVSQILILTEDNEYIQAEIKRLAAPKALQRLLKKVLQVDPDKRISAKQALNEQYFSDKQEEKPCLIQNDETLKEFIEKRIQIYDSTRGTIN